MDSVRLDIWLDVACLFKTRSAAQKACKGGKVEMNGQSVKPHREIRAGDEIVIRRPLGRRQRIVVRVLTDRHVARSDARTLYEDLTPPRHRKKWSCGGWRVCLGPFCGAPGPAPRTSGNAGNCAA